MATSRIRAPQLRAMAAAASPQKQRIAIVTGGAQGLGEAICRELAAGGDKVIVADIKEDMGRSLASAIGGDFVHCDVTEPEQVQSLMEGAAATHGSVDVVVANAGIAPPRGPMPVHAVSDEDWLKIQQINGFGVFLTCKHALRQMLKQESGGVLLGMGSVCGMTGHGGTSPYNFTKAGIIGLTKTIATEYRNTNIRMNCLCPNTTDTPLVRAFLEQTTQEVKDQFNSLSPVPGMIQASHVGHVAAMLCSENKFLTGVVVPIDGGYTAANPNYKSTDYVALAQEKERAQL